MWLVDIMGLYRVREVSYLDRLGAITFKQEFYGNTHDDFTARMAREAE